MNNTINLTNLAAANHDRMLAETILANTKELGGIRIGYLPMSLMFVDYAYQRPTRSKVQKIAADFDDNKCGLLLVSYRNDGRFAIIDGGNRFEAARLVGKTALNCQILTDLSVQQEALVFAAQNDNRVRLTENDLLKAQVCAGDEIAIGFQNLCKEFGVRLYQSNDVGYLVCTKTARRYYAEDAAALRWVFSMICKAKWNTVRKGFSVYSITPLWNLYQDYAGHVEEIESKLLALMIPLTPQAILHKAQSLFVSHTRVEAMTSLLSCYLEGKLPLQQIESAA